MTSKRVGGLAVVLAVLAWSFFRFQAASVEETTATEEFKTASEGKTITLLDAKRHRKFRVECSETQQLSVPLPSGGTLHVTTQNGRITARSGDVNKVQITAEKVVRATTAEEAKRFCDETKILTEAEPSGTIVYVVPPEDHSPHASIAVNIEAIVPRECNLDLRSSNGGIETVGIQGNVEMRTSNGRIVGEKIDGRVFARTSNGHVRLESIDGHAYGRTSNGSVWLEKLSGPAEAFSSNGELTIKEAEADLRCRTSNGNILLDSVRANAKAVSSCGSVTCVLPDDTSATLSGRTTHGRITSEFPLSIKRRRLSSSLSGKIGDGKSLIELRTTIGSISLKRKG